MNATAGPAARAGMDRWFLLLLGGVLVLLLVAGITVAVVRQPAPALPADTPGRTVQQFYEALAALDYQRAYDLLSDQMAGKPTREDFVRFNADQNGAGQTAQRVLLVEERTSGDFATVIVSVTVHYANGGPFGGSEYTTSETFSLHHDQAGWRISDLPYRYRPYPAKPVPPTQGQGG